MITVDQYDYIRTAHRIYGKKIRQIARETGHSKNTVKKVLKNEYVGYNTRQHQPFPSLEPYLRIIDKWIESDKEQPKKQRHTATRIYHRLCNEYQYEGSASTVRRYVRIAKQRIGCGSKQVFIPLEPSIGQEAEIDWGTCIAILNGEKVRLKLFCMRSKFSGKHFVRCYPCERQQSFFDAHVQAFSYFGGIFPVLIYDNLTTAVRKVLKGKKRIYQKEYAKFQAYYNFSPRFCNPGQGHEKGGVEGLVGYARRNYMVPIPKADSLEHLNEMLLQECLSYGDHRINGREQSVKESYELEKSYLLSLPEIPFSNILTTEGKSDKYSTVIIDKNHYSVPIEYAYLRVRAVLTVNQINIYYGSKKIATHDRLYNNNQWQLDPAHYLELIRQRPQAFDSARPIKQWRKSWPSCYEKLLLRFCNKQGNTKGTRDFITVLMLHSEHNTEEVKASIEKALMASVSTSHAVVQILQNASGKKNKTIVPLKNWQTFPPPDISIYGKIGGAV